jgi:hypothetical protein
MQRYYALPARAFLALDQGFAVHVNARRARSRMRI